MAVWLPVVLVNFHIGFDRPEVWALNRADTPFNDVLILKICIANRFEGKPDTCFRRIGGKSHALDSDFSCPIVSMASAEWATAAPARISAATQIASMISCGL